MVRNKKKIDWTSGLGSELLTAAMAVVGVIMIIAIVVFFGAYNSEIQAQIVADIISDGSCAYARTNMNMAAGIIVNPHEETEAQGPLAEMAQKLYTANSTKNNGVQLSGGRPSVRIISYHGYLNTKGPLVTDISETKALRDRSTIMSSSSSSEPRGLPTKNFDVNKIALIKDLGTEMSTVEDANTEGLDTLFKSDNPDYFYVPYEGPQYMDQVVTISVTASYKIPYLEHMTTKTKTSTTLCVADVPYNSRIPKSSDLQSYANKLEQLAFSDQVVYGSVQQKILLEAKRALGDGYNQLDRKEQQWPLIGNTFSLGGLSTIAGGGNSGSYYTGTNANNFLKDCNTFLQSCFMFDGMSGLGSVESKVPFRTFTRSVKYERTISAEALWEMMHAKEVTYKAQWPSLTYAKSAAKKAGRENDSFLISNRYAFYKSGSGYQLDTFSYNRGKWSVISKKVGSEDEEWEVVQAPTSQYEKIKLSNGNAKTLAEMLEEYGGMDQRDGGTGSKIWRIAESTGLESLEVGDVLIYINPNWLKYVVTELKELAKLKEKDASVFAKYDTAPVGRVSHFAIYLGNNEIIDCNYNGYGKTGVTISTLLPQALNAPVGYTGGVIAEVIRFQKVPVNNPTGTSGGGSFSTGEKDTGWED